jgi:serine/threonine-protein kinase
MDEGGRPPGDGRIGGSASGFRAGLVLDGRYRLERPLGEGGMGTVWVGRQLALQREVAVKSLRIAAPALRTRLQREALALASLHHPSIVQVYDYGETAEGVPYLVMELVRGEPLSARIRRRGPLSAAEAVKLVLPLLDGLAAAHAAGVIHRDVKPDNVMLEGGAAGVTPKLLDFGIARLERAVDPDDDAQLTLDGGLVGTPAYMAPEQFRGASVDERVDVWSTAAMLYHLLAGEPPFKSDDVMAVMRRVLFDPPPYPRKAQGLDGRLWGILMAALRKAPIERTSSALALREGLAGWLEARGGDPGRSTPTPEPARISVGSSAVSSMETTAEDASRTPASGPEAGPFVSSRQAPGSTAGGEDEAPPAIDALIRAKLSRD